MAIFLYTFFKTSNLQCSLDCCHNSSSSCSAALLTNRCVINHVDHYIVHLAISMFLNCKYFRFIISRSMYMQMFTCVENKANFGILDLFTFNCLCIFITLNDFYFITCNYFNKHQQYRRHLHY